MVAEVSLNYHQGAKSVHFARVGYGWARNDIVREFAAGDTATSGGRLPISHDTLRIASEFWLTRTGLNTYGVATLFYQTSLPGRHLREAHNEYLQLATEGGLLLGFRSSSRSSLSLLRSGHGSSRAFGPVIGYV